MLLTASLGDDSDRLQLGMSDFLRRNPHPGHRAESPNRICSVELSVGEADGRGASAESHAPMDVDGSPRWNADEH